MDFLLVQFNYTISVKKILIVCLCFVLIFANGVFALELDSKEENGKVENDNMLKESIKLGEEFLTNYYSTIVENKEFEGLNFISKNELKEYVKLKHLLMKERLINSNTIVENSNIDVTYHGHSDSENGLEVVFNVLQKKKYHGSSDMSESMNQVRLTFYDGKQGLEIVDYFELDFFDMNINQIYKSNAKRNAVNIENEDLDRMTFNKELISILKQQLLDEREFYENLKKVSNDKLLLSNENQISSSNVRTSTTSWNRSAIKTYAINNANKATPNSGNSSQASYYDFSELGFFDCTNFASHCMLAGGASENRNSWYYDSLSNRTPSWAGVNEFHEFITTNGGTGPQGDEIPFTYNCPYQYINWEDGDIVQIQYSSYGYPGFGHSTIITGKYYTPEPLLGLLYSPKITSRTNDYSYCIDEPLIIKYPLSDPDNVAYRLIHLTAIGN